MTECIGDIRTDALNVLIFFATSTKIREVDLFFTFSRSKVLFFVLIPFSLGRCLTSHIIFFRLSLLTAFLLHFHTNSAFTSSCIFWLKDWRSKVVLRGSNTISMFRRAFQNHWVEYRSEN